MNRPASSDTVLGMLSDALSRVAAAVERWAPPALDVPDFSAAEAFIWNAAAKKLDPVAKVNRVEMMLLKGIDRMRDTLQ